MANITNNNIIRANVVNESPPAIADIEDAPEIYANIESESITPGANVEPESNVIKGNPTTVPSATTEQKGIIRIATDEEAIDGTLANVAITPYTLKLATCYVHEQGTSSNTWAINHNLNKYPSVTLVDSAGTQFQGRVEYIDENNCVVYMNGATKGKAYLN